MRKLTILLLFAFTFAVYASADVFAEEIPVSATGGKTASKLTLDQAIINVLEHSPVLKAADYEARAAAARIRTAKQTPRYHGSIELENFAGSGPLSETGELETTLSLSRVLELGDKARLRGELSHNKAMLLRNNQDARRLDLLAEASKRFLEVIADQQGLLNANEFIEICRHTEAVVRKRVNAGKSPTAELGRAEIALARAELKLLHAKHKLDSTRLKLATMWGETQVSFAMADADLFQLEQLKPFDSLVKLLEQNPDLLRFTTQKRLSQSQSLLARSESRSDLEITGGLRHFNSTDDTALVMSLSVPFGSSSRAKSAIEEVEMMSLSEPHLYQQRQLELYSTLYELYQEAGHALAAVSALRETIIPRAEQALLDYDKGYLAGRYSFLELTEAQQLLLDLKLETVIAASDYHRYLIEIDRLTGAGLATGVTP